jgi:hypothetical protein
MVLNPCGSATGGGRYRCCLPVFHEGRHSTAGVFLTWDDGEQEPKAQRNRNGTNETGAPTDAGTPATLDREA